MSVTLIVVLAASTLAQTRPPQEPAPPPPPGTTRVVSFDRGGGRLAVCAEEPGDPIVKGARRIPRTQVYVAEKNVISRTTIGPGACDPAWSPDGTRLAVTAPDGLWVLQGDLKTGERVVDSAAAPGATTEFADVLFAKPRWSPDGRRIGLLASNGGTSWVEVVDAQTGRRLYKSDAEVYSFTWSADSRSIVIGDRTIRVP
jgi:dipeptidyl aminopeptidase/acylaminoacyl peptidase